MCNPDVPNEVLVTEIEDMYVEGGFITGKVYGADVRLSLSFYAIQHLFAYAIKTGCIISMGNEYYRTRGQLRRYKYGKHTPKGT